MDVLMDYLFETIKKIICAARIELKFKDQKMFLYARNIIFV